MDSGLATEAMPDEYVSSLRISKFLLVNAESASIYPRKVFTCFGSSFLVKKLIMDSDGKISSYEVLSC
jgi:hypothetical protein